MTRCATCNGIIAKRDLVCFCCGSQIPGRKAPMSTGMRIAVFLTLFGIASLGISAYLLHLV